MSERPRFLVPSMISSPRFILTNDDGIGAPGLEALKRLVGLAGDHLVVAPAEEHSGAGHRVTTRHPVNLTEIAPRCYRVTGTPADCVRIALRHLAPEASWVIAGINRGGNLGVDTYMSGTVAAAREATVLGYRGLALSHYLRPAREVDWDLAIRRVRPLLFRLLDQPPRPGQFWNVNLPDPDHGDEELEAVFCPLEPGSLDVRYHRDGDCFQYRGDYHARPRSPGTDVDVCFGGRISVSSIPLTFPGGLVPQPMG